MANDLIAKAPTMTLAALVANYLTARFSSLRLIIRGQDVFTDGRYYGLVLEMAREAAAGYLAGVCTAEVKLTNQE